NAKPAVSGTGGRPSLSPPFLLKASPAPPLSAPRSRYHRPRPSLTDQTEATPSHPQPS
ncbi:hypothetical protein KUCAC02_025913, partial [Chaenocephalus aceratus]